VEGARQLAIHLRTDVPVGGLQLGLHGTVSTAVERLEQVGAVREEVRNFTVQFREEFFVILGEIVLGSVVQEEYRTAVASQSQPPCVQVRFQHNPEPLAEEAHVDETGVRACDRNP